MTNLITIKQLLESVDLDFEPRFVTKNKNGYIYIWGAKPHKSDDCWTCGGQILEYVSCNHLKLSEFDNKLWALCIYEVPRKTTGKIEQIALPALVDEHIKDPFSRDIWIHTIVEKVAELVDAVNKLKGVGE